LFHLKAAQDWLLVNNITFGCLCNHPCEY